MDEIDQAFLTWMKKYSFDPGDPAKQDEVSRFMAAALKVAFQAGWVSAINQKEKP